MRHLLVIAHGSRRQASNDEIRCLTQRLAQRAGDRFDHVAVAFLELASPSIPEAVDACVDAGAKDILVLPYFLSAGRHVAEDIPAELAPAQSTYAGVNIRVLPYVGAGEGMLDLILGMVEGR